MEFSKTFYFLDVNGRKETMGLRKIDIRGKCRESDDVTWSKCKGDRGSSYKNRSISIPDFYRNAL